MEEIRVPDFDSGGSIYRAIHFLYRSLSIQLLEVELLDKFGFR